MHDVELPNFGVCLQAEPIGHGAILLLLLPQNSLDTKAFVRRLKIYISKANIQEGQQIKTKASHRQWMNRVNVPFRKTRNIFKNDIKKIDAKTSWSC